MVRATLLAIVLVAGALIVSAAHPGSVEATCGTAWASEDEPPETILVLRTANGAVEEVEFKHYVVMVMASGEWPTTLPEAMLEAGAMATKQYGWYYALQGNHRDDYKTASGRCYDVRDDSRDQIYDPHTAEPTDKQRVARDALWGLSLRKHDRFLLTGYRRGEDVKCGADADEWHLYVESAKDCVKRLDYDTERVLSEYYGPALTRVWAPGTSPGAEGDVSAPDAPDPEPSETNATDTTSGAFGAVSSWLGGLFGGQPDPSAAPD